MTMGSRAPAAQWSISCMSARPWALVAVNVRAPALAAPISAAIAECSDSTLMNLARSAPVAHISLKSSTIWVWGVIGYAEITWARASITP
jgi:hypothetical protein